MGHSCERNVLDEQPAKIKAAEFLCFGCGGWRVVLRGSRLPSEGPHFSSLHRAISLPEPIKCFRSFLAAIHLLSISSDHRGAELSCSSTGATQMNVFLLHVRCVSMCRAVLNDPCAAQFLTSSSIWPAGSMGWNGFNVSVIKRMENLSVAKRLNTRLARARDSKESTRLSFHSGLLAFKKEEIS